MKNEEATSSLKQQFNQRELQLLEQHEDLNQQHTENQKKINQKHQDQALNSLQSIQELKDAHQANLKSMTADHISYVEDCNGRINLNNKDLGDQLKVIETTYTQNSNKNQKTSKENLIWFRDQLDHQTKLFSAHQESSQNMYIQDLKNKDDEYKKLDDDWK